MVQHPGRPQEAPAPAAPMGLENGGNPFFTPNSALQSANFQQDQVVAQQQQAQAIQQAQQMQEQALQQQAAQQLGTLQGLQQNPIEYAQGPETGLGVI
jgi:hypothetical protein